MQSHDTDGSTASGSHPTASAPLDAHRLIELADDRGSTRLSLYLPLPAGASLGPKMRIRVKNLLAHAERTLRAEGMRVVDVTELLDAARRLLGGALSSSQNGAGLAVFAGPGRAQCFRVPLRVPQMVVVGHGYALGPLLPLLSVDDRFFTLTLSQDEIRLYEGNRFRLDRMDLEGLEIATWLTLPLPGPAQVHAFVAGRGGSTTQPMFHGTSGQDDRKARILQHMRGVDRALREVIGGEDVPLVLAGVRSLQAIYRRANGHLNLLPQGIDGNPRDMRLHALHRQSWAIAETLVHRAESAALLRYADLRGAGRTLHDVDDVLPATEQGRVESLLLAADSGRARSTANVAPVIRRQHTHGLPERVEGAAIATVRHGGAVFVLPPSRMPGGVPIAAVLRY